MGLLDDIRGLLTPKPAVVPNPFDRQANAAIPIMGASEILPNMVGRMTGSPMAEFAAGFLSPSSWIKQPNKMKIFAGKGAKTADIPKLEKAQDMAKAGSPREAIWKETGWWQGPDKQWRFEIPDNMSKMNDLPINKSWEDFSHNKEAEIYGRRGARVESMNSKEFKEFKKNYMLWENEYNKTNKIHRPINNVFQHFLFIS